MTSDEPELRPARAAGLGRYLVRLPLAVALGPWRWRTATLVEGPAGWGECSPLPGYADDEPTAARAAEEAATRPWPTPVRAEVAVNALVPAIEPSAVGEHLRRHCRGARAVKVKVGDPGGLDRVAAVRDHLGPAAAVRVDANGAWDLAAAERQLRRMAAYDLELAEQPVADLADLAALRRRVGVAVAADEAVRDVADARRLARLGAADAVVVKVQAVGGLATAAAVIEAAGVPAVVSSLYETSVGLAVGLALAASLPELPYACGLGTASLLAADVVEDPLVAVDGVLAVRRVVPTPALLARYADPGPPR